MSAVDTTTVADKEKADKILEAIQPEAENPAVVDKPVPPETAQDDIVKPIPHKEWVVNSEYEMPFKGGEVKTEYFKRTYIQKPLSYLAFGEFTGLIGRKIQEAMRVPGGLSIDRIQTPGDIGLPLEFNDGQLSVAQGVEGVDAIVQGIATIASYVPDFMGEAQCIWLRVPRHERGLLLDIWARPVDEGGMSMDNGEEMLSIFIEQNYDELMNFLKRYARVKDKIKKMRERKESQES
jgi:hypothetical protein